MALINLAITILRIRKDRTCTIQLADSGELSGWRPCLDGPCASCMRRSRVLNGINERWRTSPEIGVGTGNDVEGGSIPVAWTCHHAKLS
jgi:hypothetical protein